MDQLRRNGADISSLQVHSLGSQQDRRVVLSRRAARSVWCALCCKCWWDGLQINSRRDSQSDFGVHVAHRVRFRNACIVALLAHYYERSCRMQPVVMACSVCFPLITTTLQCKFFSRPLPLTSIPQLSTATLARRSFFTYICYPAHWTCLPRLQRTSARGKQRCTR